MSIINQVGNWRLILASAHVLFSGPPYLSSSILPTWQDNSLPVTTARFESNREADLLLWEEIALRGRWLHNWNPMAFEWGEKLPNTTSFIRHRAAETLRQDEMEKGRWEDREESGRARWERSFQKLQDVQLGPITAALIATNHCLMLRQAIRHGCLSGRAERMGKLAPPIKTSARRKRSMKRWRVEHEGYHPTWPRCQHHFRSYLYLLFEPSDRHLKAVTKDLNYYSHTPAENKIVNRTTATFFTWKHAGMR